MDKAPVSTRGIPVQERCIPAGVPESIAGLKAPAPLPGCMRGGRSSGGVTPGYFPSALRAGAPEDILNWNPLWVSQSKSRAPHPQTPPPSKPNELAEGCRSTRAFASKAWLSRSGKTPDGRWLSRRGLSSWSKSAGFVRCGGRRLTSVKFVLDTCVLKLATLPNAANPAALMWSLACAEW